MKQCRRYLGFGKVIKFATMKLHVGTYQVTCASYRKLHMTKLPINQQIYMTKMKLESAPNLQVTYTTMICDNVIGQNSLVIIRYRFEHGNSIFID